MIVLTIKKAPELNSGGYKKTGKQPACSAFEYPFTFYPTPPMPRAKAPKVTAIAPGL